MAATETTPTAKRGLRADALRNRQRILEVARRIFQERGVDAPLDEVAEGAGVGAGTLYRHFPTRVALIEAVFEEELGKVAAVGEEALRGEDPWVGLTTYFERLCGAMAADRGLGDLFLLRMPASEELEGVCDSQSRALSDLLLRAQQAGVVRDDLVPEDLFLFLVANGAVTQMTRCAAPHAWRRLAAILLDACRPGNNGPLPAAPTPLQTERVKREHAEVKGLRSPQASC
jgi:AcrR family transcriptional regulator